MKFLVIGCGSIGERHIKNLKTFPEIEIVCCDLNTSRLLIIEQRYGIKTYSDLDQALSDTLTAVLICTPTSTHISLATMVANRGYHLFIEKPLSHKLDGFDELFEIVSRKKLIALVGCNMRFSPTLKLIKKFLDNGSIGRILSAKASCGFYLPYWHPKEDYRKSYTANSYLGGGIILDDIHELDYFRWLLGDVKELFCFSEKISNLEIDTEDIAAILIKFENNVIAEIHLDCLQHVYRRSCEFIGDKGLIVADFIEKTVKTYTDQNRDWQTFYDNLDSNQAFIDEMKHFIDCIEGRDKPQQDLQSAKEVLDIALAAKESAKTGKIKKYNES